MAAGKSVGRGTPTETGEIADNAVTDAKLRDSGALSVIGRSANSSGDPADISATAASAAVLRESGSTVGFGTVATAGVADNAITDAKLADMAANSVKANATAGAADPVDLAVGANTVVGRVAGNIVAAQLATAQVADAAVTLAKMADIATARFIGRTTALTGVPEALTTAQATALLDAATATVKGLVPAPPNNTTTFLRGDATFAAPAAAAATVARYITEFAAAVRWSETIVGGANSAVGAGGLDISTSATATSSIRVLVQSGGAQAGAAYQLGSPLVSIMETPMAQGTDYQQYSGLYAITTGGSGITFTSSHIGFKITRAASGTASLFATQADGTTENASAALRTAVAGEVFDCVFKVNSTTSVDYYTRINGGALSSATNLTANIPAGNTGDFCIAISNAGVATNTRIVVSCFAYER